MLSVPALFCVTVALCCLFIHWLPLSLCNCCTMLPVSALLFPDFCATVLFLCKVLPVCLCYCCTMLSVQSLVTFFFMQLLYNIDCSCTVFLVACATVACSFNVCLFVCATVALHFLP